MSENYNITNLTVTEDLPQVCPTCGAQLEWSGADLVCNNPACSNKAYNKLYRFISVVGCNGLKNIGPSMIDELITAASKRILSEDPHPAIGVYLMACAKDMVDFFNSTYFEDNFGKVTAEKYRSVVENMLNHRIDKDLFLYAMNIPGLGWEKCQTIARTGAFDSIVGKSSTDWIPAMKSIKGVGSSLIESINDELEYIRFMARLINYLFNEVEVEESKNLRYVTVTGSLSISRSQFDELIKSYGWAVDSNIKNSEYLVTNNPDPTSSKGKKAKELGKKIITEQEFYKIIGATPKSNAQGAITVGELM